MSCRWTRTFERRRTGHGRGFHARLAGALSTFSSSPEGISSSAAGQLFEFRVWAHLIAQSQGGLHVFLPLLDSGLDGVAHRLSDGAYLPIQCKSRAALRDSMLNIVVQAESLVDDSAWLIVGLNALDGIGPTVLVVPVGEFRRLAALEEVDGRRFYEASFSMHPGPRARWGRWLRPVSELAAPLLGEGAGAGARAAGGDAADWWGVPPAEREQGRLGFLGEAEVIRRLAESARLDLFRPFPDLETVEVLARGNEGRGWCGLQVKSGSVARSIPRRAHFSVRRGSFTAAATTCLVMLAWLPEAGRFHESCLLVPTLELDRVASVDGRAWEIVFDPDSSRRTKLDPYRVRLADLAQLVVGRLGLNPDT